MIDDDDLQLELQHALEEHLRSALVESACSGTSSIAFEWLSKELGEEDAGSTLAALEAAGGLCDCAVVRVLSDGPDTPPCRDADPTLVGWAIPRAFVLDPKKTHDKLLCAGPVPMGHAHVPEGDVLVPAPCLMPPARPVRPDVHFFIGLASGLPSEYGVVAREGSPITAAELAARVSRVPELCAFGEREAGYYLEQVGRREPGQLCGVDLLRVLTDQGIVVEMSIHRAVHYVFMT